MRENKNTIMIAYIIFIGITILVYLLSLFLHFEFEAWNKIVTAVTISSYYFAIANTFKSRINTYQNIATHFVGIKSITKSFIEDLENNHITPSENKKAFVSNCKAILEEISEKEKQLDKSIKHETRCFTAFSILGFIMFFMIMCFDRLYSLFEPKQDFYTILAFVVILTSDYYIEIANNKIHNYFDGIINKAEDLMRIKKQLFKKQTQITPDL